MDIAVNCTIDDHGRVLIRRIKLDEKWLAVEQGRQWREVDGRHVLVMRPGGQVEELLLSADSLSWKLLSRRSGVQIV